jgi:hypothetical protein
MSVQRLPIPNYDSCPFCKGKLPCIECSRKLRKSLGLWGREPRDDETIPLILLNGVPMIDDHGHDLPPIDVANQAAEIRDTWDKEEERVRRGAPCDEHYEFPTTKAPKTNGRGAAFLSNGEGLHG